MTSLETSAEEPVEMTPEVEFDDDYLADDVPPPRPRAVTRLTWALLFVLTAAAGFWGGAWARGSSGSGSSASPNASALAALAAARGGATGGTAATGAAGAG
jgi:hypothetical protein